jgi:hypothetical protein
MTNSVRFCPFRAESHEKIYLVGRFPTLLQVFGFFVSCYPLLKEELTQFLCEFFDGESAITTSTRLNEPLIEFGKKATEGSRRGDPNCPGAKRHDSHVGLLLTFNNFLALSNVQAKKSPSGLPVASCSC